MYRRWPGNQRRGSDLFANQVLKTLINPSCFHFAIRGKILTRLKRPIYIYIVKLLINSQKVARIKIPDLRFIHQVFTTILHFLFIKYLIIKHTDNHKNDKYYEINKYSRFVENLLKVSL